VAALWRGVLKVQCKRFESRWGWRLRLSTVCVCALGVVFVVGALVGALAQAEQAEPGLQIVRQGSERLFNLGIAVHGGLLIVCLPCIVIALCLALISEATSSRFACTAALAAGALAAVSAAIVFGGVWGIATRSAILTGALYDVMGFAPSLFSILTACALCAVAAAIPSTRVTAILLAAPAVLAVYVGFATLRMPIRLTSDLLLSGSYIGLASDHSFGVSILLSAVGAVACWTVLGTGRSRIWFCLISTAAILASAVLWLASTTGLAYGPSLPRGYVDYPDMPQFTRGHAILAFTASIFGAVLLVVVVWLSLIALRVRPPARPEDTFD
jgi:hypothetical protein